MGPEPELAETSGTLSAKQTSFSGQVLTTAAWPGCVPVWLPYVAGHWSPEAGRASKVELRKVDG